MAANTLIATLAGSALTALLAQYVGSGFWGTDSPPPELTGFTAVTAATPSGVSFSLDYPADTSDYQQVDLRFLTGATPPNATCTNGSVGWSSTGPFTDFGPELLVATASTYYSFRVCIYDSTGNLTATKTAANVMARPLCSGVTVGGYCWYKATVAYQSCDTVCTNNGGYNDATDTYAGKNGTNSHCASVSQALGEGNASVSATCSSGIPSYGTNGGALGCCFSSAYGNGRCTGSTTTSTATGSNYSVRRLCACNY
jgi:hypothetical protein